MNRLTAAAIAIAVLTVASGCSAVAPEPASKAPNGDPIVAARSLPDAGGVVAGSDASSSCGEYVLEQGGDLPSEARACLATAAIAGDEAELAWSTPTTEGDPIVSFAFVGGSIDGVDVYTTTAFDRHNGLEETTGVGASWSLLHCADPADLQGSGDCERYVEG
ncbi:MULTISPECIES: hypothetical protein [unclassified Rathayibacter]|uniref:hypothetical protein n=1 Tax=unclassified Rathayibacter TaxID=2609250 RepID=UPI0011B07B64|nr:MULTISPECIES: hypothetical protein [unclassified Rathayibacter]